MIQNKSADKGNFKEQMRFTYVWKYVQSAVQ